jgi:uncharacterized protein
MAKFLLVIAVFIVVYLLLRNHARKQDISGRPNASGSSKPESFAYGQDMVRCNACGVHLPKSEAATKGGEFFCSQEHLQLAGRKPPQP